MPRIALLLLLVFFVSAPSAFANEDAAGVDNPFSNYVPFADEADIDEEEHFMYFGKFFGVGLGSGAQVFTGGIGQVYNTSLPVFDLRLIYFFNFRLALQMGLGLAKHGYILDESNIGTVDVNMLRFNFDLKYYFNTVDFSAGLTAMNPYIVGGYSVINRTQNFVNQVRSVKDTAPVISGGGGVELEISPRAASIGFEFRAHQVFFPDSQTTQFQAAGVKEFTGLLLSSHVHLYFYF